MKPVGKEELEEAVLKAEKMLKTDYPMEYWEKEKDDMQTVFRKMNSEAECRELLEHFEAMGLDTKKRIIQVFVFLFRQLFIKNWEIRIWQSLSGFPFSKKLRNI